MKKILLIPLAIIFALFMLGTRANLTDFPLLATKAQAMSYSGPMQHSKTTQDNQDSSGYAIDKMASWLHMQPEDLTLRLESGQTLAQIMAKQGLSKEQLHNNVKNEMSAYLDTRIQTGDIQASQKSTLMDVFDQLYNKYSDKILNTDFSAPYGGMM